jgi:hypothetical protein
MPVWIMPGQADETVTVFMGYGRQRVVGLEPVLGPTPTLFGL